MTHPIDNFYLDKEEPNKSCLLALRMIINDYNQEFEEAWKYKLPCFTYQGKIFCYLWIDKKSGWPYISINKGSKIEHPDLVQGNRTVFKLLYINPNEDIPIETIHEIFDLAMAHYD